MQTHCRSAKTTRFILPSPGPAFLQHLPDGAKLFQLSWRVEPIAEGLSGPWDGEEVTRLISLDSWLCPSLYEPAPTFVVDLTGACIRAIISKFK
jgi:hypothetical protein